MSGPCTAPAGPQCFEAWIAEFANLANGYDAPADRQLEQVWALASRATRTPRETAPRPPQPRGTTPWRGWTFSKRAISARSEGRPNIDAHK